MKFRSVVLCPMMPFLASGAKCLWGVGISLYWHGLLSLLGRTLPAKMPHLATRETFFICRIVSIRINLFFFFFSLGEAPPEGVSSKEQALYIVHASALKAPLFQKTLYLSQP